MSKVIELSYPELYDKIQKDFKKQIKKVYENMKKCKTRSEVEHYINTHFITLTK